MKKALDIVFRIGLALFLVGGIALVGIQAVGLVAGSSPVVLTANDAVGPVVYTIAGATGIIAFIRSYVENWSGGD